MATDPAPVTPAVMRWARESVGASVADAAKRADVSEERILAWEDGTQQPSLAKLRALAKLYQRPLSIFFLEEPPRDFDAMRDFRRLPDSATASWSRPLHKVYRRAIEQQEAFEELLRLEDEEPDLRVPGVTLDEDPESAGERARAALEISVKDQHTWRTPEDAVKSWIDAIELVGVLVLRTSEVSTNEMRGFSVHGEVPVIMVNALDPPRAQAFTLLHEFAHVMLRAEGLCDLVGPPSGSSQQVESWCNAVAASTVMPRDAFFAVLGDSPRYSESWDEEVLELLSARWSVSKEAVVRRLLTLELTSATFYRQKREEYREAFEAWREQQRARTRSGGPPPHRMAIRDRGRPFVRLALDAYQQNLISTASVTRLLSLKARHLPSLEKEVR